MAILLAVVATLHPVHAADLCASDATDVSASCSCDSARKPRHKRWQMLQL